VTIQTAVLTVGTALVQVVDPDNEPQRVTLTNLQPGETVGALSRAGHVFLASSKFSIANNGSAFLQITTGEYGAQFEFYEIVAANSNVYAELLEGATFGSATPFTAFNLNRSSTRTPLSTLSAATAVSGGTVISTEFIPASNQAGGIQLSAKIHTLEANTSYVMRFTDVGGNGATAYLQLGFSEQFNGANDIWLGTANNSFVLKSGQTLQLDLHRGEGLVASSDSQDCEISVMRQVYV
jgi:hypothetical protein